MEKHYLRYYNVVLVTEDFVALVLVNMDQLQSA